MVVEFQEWLSALLGTKYTPWVGPWVDTAKNKDKFLVSIQQNPGGATIVDLQRANYKVILLGPQNGRDKQLEVMGDAQTLINATIERAIIPCGAAHVRSLGAAMGPGLTEEDRAWAQLNFELIF